VFPCIHILKLWHVFCTTLSYFAGNNQENQSGHSPLTYQLIAQKTCTRTDGKTALACSSSSSARVTRNSNGHYPISKSSHGRRTKHKSLSSSTAGRFLCCFIDPKTQSRCHKRPQAGKGKNKFCYRHAGILAMMEECGLIGQIHSNTGE